jgi:hypothetical protein
MSTSQVISRDLRCQFLVFDCYLALECSLFLDTHTPLSLDGDLAVYFYYTYNTQATTELIKALFKCFACLNSFSLSTTHGLGSTIILILQLRKSRHRDA